MVKSGKVNQRDRYSEKLHVHSRVIRLSIAAYLNDTRTNVTYSYYCCYYYYKRTHRMFQLMFDSMIIFFNSYSVYCHIVLVT